MSVPDFYSRMQSSQEAEEPEEASSGSQKDFYARGKPEKSKLEKAARGITQFGIGLAERALFPYELQAQVLKSKKAQQVPYRENLFSDIERLSEQKQLGDWDEQDEKLLQSLVEQVKDPKKAEQFIQTPDIGVGGLAEKASKELFDYDLEPEGLEEQGSRILGNVLKPSTIAKGAEKLTEMGKGFVDKEFRHAVKEQKNWSRLAKAAEGNSEKETLLKFAQEHKLSPEATSLLFHSKGKADVLATIGKKTKRFKAAVSELRGKLGQNYEELKALGKDGGHLSFKSADKLTTNLEKLLFEMKSTHVIGPDTSSAIKTIEKAVESINNRGSTIRELINSRIGMGESINWQNVDRGDFFKKQGRQIFLDAIKEQNPAIGERLANTDKAWAKYEKFKDVLEPKIPVFKWKGLTLPAPLVAATAFATAPFIPLAAGGAKLIVAKEALQRLATEMAINPKLQAPLKVWQKSLMSGSTDGQKKAFLLARKLLKKEDPDLYEQLKDIETD